MTLADRPLKDPAEDRFAPARQLYDQGREAEAADWLARVGEAGDADALAMGAALAASRPGGPEDWMRAMGLLTRAAELGSASARAQLLLLGRVSGPGPSSPAEWRALGQGIDIRAWARPLKGRFVSESPRIGVVEGLIPEPFCDWLIAKAEGRLGQADILDSRIGYVGHSKARTNSDFGIGFDELDVITALVSGFVSIVVKQPIAQFEPATVLHYAPGQEFSPHCDFFDPASPALVDRLKQGQRVATLLVYLNTEFEGGETEFCKIGFRYKGGKGDALVFWNVTPLGDVDWMTEHAGLPPTSGEKWVLSQWIRGRTP